MFWCKANYRGDNIKSSSREIQFTEIQFPLKRVLMKSFRFTELHWPEERLICLNLQLRFKDCDVSFGSVNFFFL